MTRNLLSLNAVAIIFAVYHHSIYWAVTAINHWGHRFVSSATPQLLTLSNPFSILLRITDQIAGVAVPAFLFVSGFFYGFLCNQQSISRNYRVISKRILYLLIPYVVWSTITVLFRMVDGQSFTIERLARIYLLGEADAPFYYVPLIIQLIILSPLLIRVVKKSPVFLIGIALVFQLLSSIPWYIKILNLSPSQSMIFFNLFKSGYLFSHLLWFIFGLMLSVYREKFTLIIKSHRWWIFIFLLIFLILGQVEFQKFIEISGKNWINSQSSIITKWLYSLVILAFIVFGNKISTLNKINFIGANSYGIYLSHVLVIEICARMIYHVWPFLLGQTFLFLGILVSMGIFVPLLLMTLVRKGPINPVHSYIWG